MKKIIVFGLVFLSFFNFSFAKELNSSDLKAVNIVLDSKLHVNDFEELQDQLNYLDKVESQIKEMDFEISEEAKVICNVTLKLQRGTSKITFLTKQENNQKKKSSKKESEEATKKLILDCVKDYKDFADTHSDLSSHFYFRFKEAEFSSLSYLPATQQLKILKSILADYKKIEEMNPDYGEILFTYGTVLYMVPKIAGGDKELALEKCLKAVEKSSTDYEKASALTIYSQLLFEEKQKEQAKKYLNLAKKVDPKNLTFAEIQKMNDAGFSMFKESEYRKKIEKN